MVGFLLYGYDDNRSRSYRFVERRRVNADRTQYVWSSSGLITVVVMILFAIRLELLNPVVAPAAPVVRDVDFSVGPGFN